MMSLKLTYNYLSSSWEKYVTIKTGNSFFIQRNNIYQTSRESKTYVNRIIIINRACKKIKRGIKETFSYRHVSW